MGMPPQQQFQMGMPPHQQPLRVPRLNFPGMPMPFGPSAEMVEMLSPNRHTPQGYTPHQMAAMKPQDAHSMPSMDPAMLEDMGGMQEEVGANGNDAEAQQ